jgi:tRNA(fMet)-specific endonuclease VapC
MRLRLQDLSTDEVGISSIVAAELWYGTNLSQRKKSDEAALRDFMDYVTILDWPYGASHIYGRIRAMLKEKGTPIGAMDLLIASHALFLNATIVTDNISEFQQVPGLKIENWQKG